MSVLGWVQAIATGWFALSILLAVAWALGGRKIFRKPPAPPQITVAVDSLIAELKRRERINGGL
jgi:hypothetical protein